jgi:hypothetical protein
VRFPPVLEKFRQPNSAARLFLEKEFSIHISLLNCIFNSIHVFICGVRFSFAIWKRVFEFVILELKNWDYGISGYMAFAYGTVVAVAIRRGMVLRCAWYALLVVLR